MIAPVAPPHIATGKIKVGAGYTPQSMVSENIIPAQATNAVATAPAKTSILSKTFNAVRGATDFVSNIDFMLMPLGLLGGAVGWVGSKTGLKAANSAGGILKKPGEFLEVPVSTVGEKIGISNVAGRVSQQAANVTGDVVGKASSATGFGSRIGRYHEWNAERSLKKAAQHASQLNLSEIKHTEARDAIGQLQNAIKNGEAHTLSDHLGKIAELGEVEGLPKAARKMMGATERTVGYQAEAAVYKDLGGAIRSAPGKIGKAPIGATLMNGAFIASSAFSTLDVAIGFSDKLAIMREMYADMNGTTPDKVSNVKLLTGSLPAPLAAARSHVIKEHGVRGVIQAAGLVAMARSVFKTGNFSMKAFLIPTAANMGVDAFMGDSLLPMYKAINDAYKSGQSITQQDYATFVRAASPELHHHKNGLPFANAVAAEYAAEKTSPGQIMQEISNGKLMERINTIVKNNTAEQQQETTTTSMVDKVNGKAEKNRPVVGAHTAQLNGEGTQEHVR